MDYEKKYKEALELARVAAFNGHQSLMEGIFPELKESEDEKIRQKFIKLVKMSSEVGGFALHKWEADEMLAWLEKQGEQKPFDYENADIQQKDFAPKETVKEAESNLTPLERKVKDILFSFHINAADGISFDGTMAIVHNLITLCQQEQKPAWSREDEKIRQTIINEFKQCSEWYCSNGLTKEDCINWLNKQEYFEWGDEDNENMNSLCVLLDQMVSINAIGNEHSIEYKNWLKSIKQRMGG